jgi:hypothetical protein
MKNASMLVSSPTAAAIEKVYPKLIYRFGPRAVVLIEAQIFYDVSSQSIDIVACITTAATISLRNCQIEVFEHDCKMIFLLILLTI